MENDVWAIVWPNPQPRNLGVSCASLASWGRLHPLPGDSSRDLFGMVNRDLQGLGMKFGHGLLESPGGWELLFTRNSPTSKNLRTKKPRAKGAQNLPQLQQGRQSYRWQSLKPASKMEIPLIRMFKNFLKTWFDWFFCMKSCLITAKSRRCWLSGGL